MSHSLRMTFTVVAAIFAAAALLPDKHAAAQSAAKTAVDYPNRPLRFVVPFLAGGPSDVLARTLARTLAQKMNQDWGQPVVVDNRAGAAGRTRAVNRAPACGM